MRYHNILDPYGSIEDMTTRVTAAVQLGGSSPDEDVHYGQRAYDDLTKFCQQLHSWANPSLVASLNLSAQSPLWDSKSMRERQALSERARVIIHINNLHLFLTAKRPVDGEIERFFDEQIMPVLYHKQQSVRFYTSAMGTSIELNPSDKEGPYVRLDLHEGVSEYTQQQWSKLRRY